MIKVLKVLGLGLRIHRARSWAELTFDTELSTRMPSAAIPVLTTIPAVEFSKAFPAFQNASVLMLICYSSVHAMNIIAVTVILLLFRTTNYGLPLRGHPDRRNNRGFSPIGLLH